MIREEYKNYFHGSLESKEANIGLGTNYLSPNYYSAVDTVNLDIKQPIYGENEYLCTQVCSSGVEEILESDMSTDSFEPILPENGLGEDELLESLASLLISPFVAKKAKKKKDPKNTKPSPKKKETPPPTPLPKVEFIVKAPPPPPPEPLKVLEMEETQVQFQEVEEEYINNAYNPQTPYQAIEPEVYKGPIKPDSSWMNQVVVSVKPARRRRTKFSETFPKQITISPYKYLLKISYPSYLGKLSWEFAVEYVRGNGVSKRPPSPSKHPVLVVDTFQNPMSRRSRNRVKTETEEYFTLQFHLTTKRMKNWKIRLVLLEKNSRLIIYRSEEMTLFARKRTEEDKFWEGEQNQKIACGYVKKKQKVKQVTKIKKPRLKRRNEEYGYGRVYNTRMRIGGGGGNKNKENEMRFVRSRYSSPEYSLIDERSKKRRRNFVHGGPARKKRKY